jgi:methyl-accepting chemotaxis protein
MAFQTAIHRAFRPATALMGRLKYAQKFVLIGLVLLAPLAFVANAYLGQQGAQTSFSGKERVGVTYIEPLDDLLGRLVVARAAAVRGETVDAQAISESVAATDAVASLGAQLGVDAEWQKLKSQIGRLPSGGDPAQAFAAYNAATAGVQKLIVDAGNGSNLILDPDLDSFYLMDALVNKLPLLVDTAGHAGDLAHAAGGSQTLATRVQLAVDKGVIGSNVSALDSGFQTAFQSTRDGALSGSLEPQVAGFDAAAKLLQTELASMVTGEASTTPAAGDSVAKGVALAAAIAPRLDTLIKVRIGKATAKKHNVDLVSILAVLLAIYLFAGFYLAVRRALAQMRSVVEGISRGELDQQVSFGSRDEVGQLEGPFREMLTYLDQAAETATAIADGNLTVEVEARSELDRLGQAFASMIQGLREMIAQIAGTAGRVASSSQQMATTSEEAGRAVTEIANAVGEVAAGAERQVRVVNEARRSGAETAEAAEQARLVAEEGVSASERASVAMQSVRDSAAQASTAIQSLGEKSDAIGGIVETITGIAGQTNLLALNAAIEAARAGEQGRGFAVVAEEVRKLAEESKRAASSIAELVAEIQGETRHAVAVVHEGAGRTDDGVAVVEQAREAFVRIGASVREVDGRIQSILEATNEVATVAEQSSSGAQQVSASTQETSASTQQIAASAHELARTADELGALIGRFRIEA